MRAEHETGSRTVAKKNNRRRENCRAAAGETDAPPYCRPRKLVSGPWKNPSTTVTMARPPRTKAPRADGAVTRAAVGGALATSADGRQLSKKAALIQPK